MLIRIVEMHFRDDAINEFLDIFNNSSNDIRGFQGCLNLELLQDKHDHARIFTYSFWENELALNAYRNSELFKNTWSKTKILFDKQPLAYSLNRLIQVQ